MKGFLFRRHLALAYSGIQILKYIYLYPDDAEQERNDSMAVKRN